MTIPNHDAKLHTVEIVDGKRKMVPLDVQEDKCPKCKKNPATDSHICPYKQDINDDEETLCTCCDECRQECAWDI